MFHPRKTLAVALRLGAIVSACALVSGYIVLAQRRANPSAQSAPPFASADASSAPSSSESVPKTVAFSSKSGSVSFPVPNLDSRFIRSPDAPPFDLPPLPPSAAFSLSTLAPPPVSVADSAPYRLLPSSKSGPISVQIQTGGIVITPPKSPSPASQATPTPAPTPRMIMPGSKAMKLSFPPPDATAP